MATTTHVPVEVYLRSSYEPDAEYVDGKIEERPMGELEHALWQKAILRWFWNNEHEWGLKVLQELRVQVAPTRFRVPDVTVLDRSHPKEQIVTKPPVAVFEVLSPEDTMQRMKRRLEDYRAMGVAEIWVVDPEDGSWSRYEGGELRHKTTFSYGAKGIVFDLNEIKKLLDD
jgi:Uma2 family endonuclease